MELLIIVAHVRLNNILYIHDNYFLLVQYCTGYLKTIIIINKC